MDGGVRETCCSSCSHIEVCAHKDDYLNIVKSLEEMYYKFPKNEREFMILRDPDCEFYSKKLERPKPLARELTIPKNVVMATFYNAAKKYDRKTDV